MKFKFHILFLLFPVTIWFSGCLEEPNSNVNNNISFSGELSTLVETRTNLLSNETSDIIQSAGKIRSIEGNKLYLDIRTAEEYEQGHIPDAVNTSIENIVDTLLQRDYSYYKQVVVVSSTGQKAAYTAALLRMLGFKKIKSMDFGMSQWHSDFSSELISARGDSQYWSTFTRVWYPKPRISNTLPNLEVEDENISPQELLKMKIYSMLTEDAYEEAIMTISELDASYSRVTREYFNKFIICFADYYLYDFTYTWRNLSPPRTLGGHPLNAINFDSIKDFKGAKNLESLPTSRQVVVYDYNGQSSAVLVAYLRLLGYNAKFIKYGAISMIYENLRYGRDSRSFQESHIYNYYYVK